MTYQEALKEAKGNLAHCSDAAAMAAYCDGLIQFLVGAVSPRLIWEGAMRRGMTALALARLAQTDPAATEALMWQ